MIYSNVIIHAGGMVDDKTYTNSLEGINNNVLNLNIPNEKALLLC